MWRVKRSTFFLIRGRHPYKSVFFGDFAQAHTRVAFQDRSYALHLADENIIAKGPALCKITVGTQSVLELVHATPITDRALMGLSTLSALGLEMAVGGVRVAPGRPSFRWVANACVRRVV